MSFFVGGLMFLIGHGWLNPFFGRPPSIDIRNYVGAKTKKEKKYSFMAIGIGVVLFLFGMIVSSYGY